MYLGRLQLGSWLDVYLQVTDASGIPVMPDAVPSIKVRRGAALVSSGLMPLVDKSVNVGLFCSRIFLGSGFSVGMHTIEMVYLSGAKVGIESRVFEVMAGGDVHGNVLGTHWYHRPQADFIVFQTEDGSLMKGKSPRVN